MKKRVSDGDRRRDINRGGDGRIMHSSFWPGRGSGLSVRRGRREEDGGGAGEGGEKRGPGVFFRSPWAPRGAGRALD